MLHSLLSWKEIIEAFVVNPHTEKAWREKLNMPHVIIPGEGRTIIRYIPEEVASWAKAHNKSFTVPERVA